MGDLGHSLKELDSHTERRQSSVTIESSLLTIYLGQGLLQIKLGILFLFSLSADRLWWNFNFGYIA